MTRLTTLLLGVAVACGLFLSRGIPAEAPTLAVRFNADCSAIVEVVNTTPFFVQLSTLNAAGMNITLTTNFLK